MSAKVVLLAFITASLAFASAPTVGAVKAGCSGYSTTNAEGNRTTSESCAVAVQEDGYLVCVGYQSLETVRDGNETHWDSCQSGIKP